MGRREVVTEYPRRKPNPIVQLIRWAWFLFLGLMIAGWVGIVVLLIVEGALWIVPIVVVFGYFVFVLYRNRWRRWRRTT
jgi:hypothetical protein